ncbi:S9 family peptidase [Luteimonas sp. BDR2-5]|uniref:S9 family peptidase n=1 Tax=Proluteimonas luteida TaxID=2878685 RepID=UPI001E5474AE|nr:S9 family peptidase [Luteimonas sp. BDR2-5]MCD9028203.1 S9 family peptidase [Luteimonas sp. BDR2-5]
MIRKGLQWLCMVMVLAACLDLHAQVDLAPFVEEDGIRDIKISPTGEYYAVTLPLGDRTAVGIMRRADRTIAGSFRLPKNTHVADFWWANDERLVFGLAERFGSRDFPSATGELYGMNVDGGRAQLLVGWRVQGTQTGTRIQSGAKEEFVHAWPIDLLPDDPRNILVSVSPFTRDPVSRVDRMDVYTGRRTTVATVPVNRASFLTDHAGEVRFAVGARADNLSRLYYRDGRGADWQLINDERTSGRLESPVGFSGDDRKAYLRVSQPSGPDAIVELDVASGERRELLRDALVDPEIVYRPGTSTPVGVRYLGATPRLVFFDEASEDARLGRMFEKAFPGQVVRIASATRDASVKLLLATSDVDPGSFFTYDAPTKKADFALARRNQVDPERMAPMQGVSLPARDGLMLHGYLTRPASAAADRPLPLVVLPHGGPFGIFDDWAFDPDVQLLAQAGYAVLQLNFRGSGNYGRSFRQAGARQWGGTMQDDLTDATRWAIEQGHADPQRICIYGGSYGGYAALMGVAREPDLYRCAVGYVGVYDLPLMRSQDRRGGMWLRTWVDEWVGNDVQRLGETSPTRLAGRIRAPVLLVAGGEDEIAPVEHTRRMERALRGAGVPVETMYVDNEGHGFYKPENRRAYYTRLLAFLSTHLGGATAAE